MRVCARIATYLCGYTHRLCTRLFNVYPTIMGHKQYLKVGQSAKNKLFGVAPSKRQKRMDDGTPINMLISEQGKISSGKSTFFFFFFLNSVTTKRLKFSFRHWLHEPQLFDKSDLKKGKIWKSFWTPQPVLRILIFSAFDFINEFLN